VHSVPQITTILITTKSSHSAEVESRRCNAMMQNPGSKISIQVITTTCPECASVEQLLSYMHDIVIDINDNDISEIITLKFGLLLLPTYLLAVILMAATFTIHMEPSTSAHGITADAFEIIEKVSPKKKW
jgi:hypothetical protein